MNDFDQELRKCVICKEKATGKNFNVFTCESCKAFFRRNALKLKEYKCSLRDNCSIDITTRKLCRKCRLQKCFDSGMKKEYILSEEQKQMRKVRKQVNGINNCKLSADLDTGDSSQESVATTDTKSSCDGIVHHGEPNDCDHSVVIMDKLIADKRPLAEWESTRLREMMTILNELKNQYKSKLVAEVTDLDMACRAFSYNCERDAYKFIRLSNSLTAFQSMCENDKISLLKYGSLEMFCLRLITTYDIEKQFWTFMTDTNNMVVMKLDLLANARRNIFTFYRNFLHSVGTEWDSDFVILDLLTIIVLFNDHRPHLIHRDLVKCQKHIYMHLLQKYLKVKYRTQSDEKLLKLMNGLENLHQLSAIHFTNYLEAPPEYIGPLLREMLDTRESVIKSTNFV